MKLTLNLTNAQEFELRNIFRIEHAKDILNCFGINYENLSSDKLIDIAIEIENEIDKSCAGIEADVLTRLGYL